MSAFLLLALLAADPGASPGASVADSRATDAGVSESVIADAGAPALAAADAGTAEAAAKTVPNLVVVDAGPAEVFDAGWAPLVVADAGPAAPPTYGSVVVAERQSASLTGASATTVTRSQIEALPGGDNQTVAHLVEMQPGAVADNAFGFGTHVRAADGAVLYVIDGIPLMPPPIGMLGQTLDAIPTRLVQNVQVYTGGFPVEYSYALGGVVDIQTRRAASDPTAEGQVAYGTYNATTASLNYSQAFGKLSLIASGDFVSTDRGFDTPDAVSILHDGRVGGEGFLKADYEIDSANRLSLIATYSENHFQIPIDPTMLPLSDSPPGAIRGNDAYGNAPPQFVPYNADPTDLERSLLTAVSYVHTGEVSSQASLYMRQMYADYNCDPENALGATADPGSFCASITRRAYHFGAVGNLMWHWLPGNSWKAGIAIDDQQNDLGYSEYTRNDASPTGGFDPSLTLTGSDQINTLSVGAYVEDRIELGKLTLLPGFRYDFQNTTFGSSDQSPLFLNGPSLRLGGSYAVSDWILLHAFAGYLWESPVDFDGPLAAQILIPSLGGQTLPDDIKASTTWSAEVGVTVHPVSKLTLGLTAWGRYSTNTIDRQTVGTTDLFVSFNWDHGRAAGGDLFANGELLRFRHDSFLLEGFGNLSYQNSQSEGLASEKYLFTPDEASAAASWTTMDHVQFWTANVGLLLHDRERVNNLSVRFNYGSGFHTGVATNELVPEHTTVDASLSHAFKLPGRPELAFDAFNLFNDIYAYRMGTAYFGNAEYAALRHFDVRLTCHFE